jgi:hypothetical protein
MAKIASASPIEQSVAHLIRLLIEYTQKLGGLTTELSAIAGRGRKLHLEMDPEYVTWRRDALIKRFNGLKPAIEDLARRSSGFIENSAMDETVRIELRLRVSELESMIYAMKRALEHA